MEPPSSRGAKKEWRLEIDQAAQFVEEECTVAPGHFVSHAEVFTAFQSWASLGGVRMPLGKKGLGDRLVILGFKKKNNGPTGGRGFLGLQLGRVNPSQDDIADFH